MPFPADENYCYVIVQACNPSRVLRFLYTSGVNTDDTRNTARVNTNVPNSSDLPPVTGGNRRVYSNNAPVAPFGVLPYTGTVLRRVVNSVPSVGVPNPEDFNVGTALLAGEFHITERDFYRYYLMHYLSFLDTAKLSKGQLSTQEYADITYLTNLCTTGFVTGAVLPTLPNAR